MKMIEAFILSEVKDFIFQITSINDDFISLILVIIVVYFLYKIIENSFFVSSSKTYLRK